MGRGQNSINKMTAVSKMTDRERRAYKWKRRRQRELRRKIATAVMTFCLIMLCVISYQALSTSANSDAGELIFKYYTRVVVHSGDTLWTIADDYIDYSQYKDKKEYIREVCSINGFYSDDTLRIGQTIIVPYYSSEYKK